MRERTVVDVLDQIPTHSLTIARHEDSDAVAVIALNSLVRGPGLGGTRIRFYPTFVEGVEEACRLAAAMTRKASIANLPQGGGKAVILSPDKELPQSKDDSRRPSLMKWFGSIVEGLKGQYITCEDSGTTPEDMAIVKSSTNHVVGIPSGYGDPSPRTADGVVLSIEYYANKTLGRGVDGMAVSIQGIGHVGRNIAERLIDRGALVTVADPVDAYCTRLAAEYPGRVTVVSPEEIASVPCEVFCPCAFGLGITEDYARSTGAKAVIGAANNQLATPRAGEILFERGIFYGPDYVVNAGGLILMTAEAREWPLEEVDDRVAAIAQNLDEVAQHSERTGKPMNVAADDLADARVK